MVKKSFWSFLGDQFRTVPPVVHADLKGKTVMVVGANTGLGYEATQHFARMNPARLILACRSREKGEAAIERLKSATGYATSELWIVDLADFASVQAFVDKAIKELERLDILLLNAAVANRRDGVYVPTKDGWEIGLQVNNISPSLIALHLLQRMLDTAKRFNVTPRLVIVSSEVHFWTTLEDKVFQSSNAFELLGSKEYCTPKILGTRYLDTKLLNVFFTRALNARLQGAPIIVNTVNPGFCHSELQRNNRSFVHDIMTNILARSSEQGGRQFVYACVGVPECGEDELRGGYISLHSVDEPSDFVLGEEGQRKEDKLWDDLIWVLKKLDPRVTDIIAQHLS